MAFCTKCGKPLGDPDRFCPACGTPSGTAPAGEAAPGTGTPPPPPTPPRGSVTGLPTLEEFPRLPKVLQMAWIFAGSLAALAVLSLVQRDLVGLVLSGGAAALAYLKGVQEIRAGRVAEGANLCRTLAVAIGILSALLFLWGGTIAVLGVAAAVPGYLAWKETQRRG